MKLLSIPDNLLVAAALMGFLCACSTPPEPRVASTQSTVTTRTTTTITTTSLASATNAAASAKVATPKSDFATLQGNWKGREVGGDEGAATIAISGNTLDCHGTDPNDWYKGTFTLREEGTPKQ